MSKLKYKIKEKHEDPNQVILEKTGDVVTFTPLEIINNLQFAYKKKRELEAMWRIAEATKKNIEETHPEVKNLSAELLTAAFLYREQIGIANESSAKLEQFQEVIEADELALKEAETQTGLSFGYKSPEPVKPAAPVVEEKKDE